MVQTRLATSLLRNGLDECSFALALWFLFGVHTVNPLFPVSSREQKWDGAFK